MRISDWSSDVCSSDLMAVLDVTHPDVMEFITAKQERGQLNNFNVSVGVTDDFMRAVESDTSFELTHVSEPSAELKEQGASLRADGLWVYRAVRAREVWDLRSEERV